MTDQSKSGNEADTTKEKNPFTIWADSLEVKDFIKFLEWTNQKYITDFIVLNEKGLEMKCKTDRKTNPKWKALILFWNPKKKKIQ